MLVLVQIPSPATVCMGSSDFDKHNFKCIHLYMLAYIDIYIHTCTFVFNLHIKVFTAVVAGRLLFRSDDTKEQ